MSPLLEVLDLHVDFGRRRAPAVNGVSFAIEPGQRIGLIGESGSGKTVTALAVMGLLPETAHLTGSMTLSGRELSDLGDKQYSQLRGTSLGMVFQEPMTALDPTMRVGRQVAEVGLLRGQKGDVRARVLRLLQQVGFDDPERVAQAYPHQLSGGQRQRIVIAMAVFNGPDLVICDEPTTALDVTVQARVLALLDEILTDARAACLFISHDLAVVSEVCSEALVMLDGRIVERGPVAHVLADPQHPYTKGLVATARLDRVQPGARLPTIGDFYQRGAMP